MASKTTKDPVPEGMGGLREQLMDAARVFGGGGEDGLSKLLNLMVGDIERASAERLEIVPVAHHSPACGLHMVRRLQQKAPKVIFIEMCEDMRGLLPDLGDCKLPVALQGFAGESDAFPRDWAPLTVVAPLTEFSAEYQAMAYALAHNVELVFVDRSVDHIFQQLPQRDDALNDLVNEDEDITEDEEEGQQRAMHGSALGVELGSVMPTFQEFQTFLLRNANVRTFAEWWDQYVEQTVLAAEWDTFRHVMFLVGSLLRRLGRREQDTASDRWRERYMWTRMKDYLRDHKLNPEDAIYICGAIHAVSDVEEYGTHTNLTWEIPPSTNTQWLYGLIPSSYSAIEHQFHHPAGTITLAEETWKKGLETFGLKNKTHKIGAKAAPKAAKQAGMLPATTTDSGEQAVRLYNFLTRPPEMALADEEQLLEWSVEIVKLARKNGYLATTADSISIYQTAKLLSGLRNRQHPTPNDFRDAAITCLEKERTPKKRDIPWLCDILLGGDRTGTVGYASLPPLAKNVYDRLKVLPINLNATTIQRALMDFKQDPQYLPASDLLWKLVYLVGEHGIVRPIMGERSLGKQPQQESWDISIGKNQRAIIQLGYEGVTVEQVLELRLKKKAFGPRATTTDALQATEDSILYLKSRRLTDELGQRAVELLRLETGAADAPDIFERVRRLVHYYRSTPEGLADWIKRFVADGYSHYSTLLPGAFADTDTSPKAISGMLGFIFTLESLALSLGCDRSELLIAIRQSGLVSITADKIGLLWSAQLLLGEKPADEIREFFDEVIENPLMIPMLPDYIGGFVLALQFTPLVGRLVVELISKAFARLPDRILLPWLPALIMTLKPMGAELMPALLKEAAGAFPDKVQALDGWQTPWERAAAKPKKAAAVAEVRRPGVELTPAQAAARGLLVANRPPTDALAIAIGAKGEWIADLGASGGDEGEEEVGGGPTLTPAQAAARGLLVANRAPADALALAIGAAGPWVEVIGGGGKKRASAPAAADDPSTKLLQQHPATMTALARAIEPK